jgi:transcriptional regulator with XRE-family HTH domain
MSFLANKIRNARLAMDFSQAYVSKKLGISQQTYSILENDPDKLSIMRFVQLCRILNLNSMDVVEQLEAEYTFGGQEDSPNAAATEREQLDHQLQAIQSSLNRLKAKLAKFNIEAK